MFRDKQKRTLWLAVVLSLLFHLALFWFLNLDNLSLFASPPQDSSIPEEVTFIFPENEPDRQKEWEVVQNMNENEEIPDDSGLLSDRNSRAKNPQTSDQNSPTPKSAGNQPFANLSPTTTFRSFKNIPQKRFSTQALTGESYKEEQTPNEQQNSETQVQPEQNGSEQMLQQDKFSVEELGALTLSTYRWNWAPYINAMKNKLRHVWYPPPAFFMGLIDGYTYIRYTVDRKGQLVEMQVLKHEGHESLELSSKNAVESLFPFLPLPDDFPDETLTITAKLHYLNMRNRR